MTETQARTFIVLLSIAVFLLAGAALRATYVVTMPLVFAFFVTVLVWPVHEAIRERLPERAEWLATVLTIFGVILAFGGVLGGIAFVVYQITSERGEEIVAEIRERWEELTSGLAERGLPVPGGGADNELLGAGAGWLTGAAASVTEVVAALVLMVFFTLLMLIEAHHWRAKSQTSMPGAHVGRAMLAIGRQVRSFLLVQTFIASVTATVTGLWLWFMDVPFVLLWTLLTFILDFIPNAGPIAAGILVSLVALLTVGWQRALVVAAGVLVIQQFFGNYLDPLLKGRRMDISPLVTLLSVVFWAWVWGPAGAVIAVPITATMIIACAHVPKLRPVALMLAHTADVEKLEEQTGVTKQAGAEQRTGTA